MAQRQQHTWQGHPLLPTQWGMMAPQVVLPGVAGHLHMTCLGMMGMEHLKVQCQHHLKPCMTARGVHTGSTSSSSRQSLLTHSTFMCWVEQAQQSAMLQVLAPLGPQVQHTGTTTSSTNPTMATPSITHRTPSTATTTSSSTSQSSTGCS
jgi:hypothetical protein